MTLQILLITIILKGGYMRSFLSISIGIAALVVLSGCDFGSNPKDKNTQAAESYQIDTANVDYEGANNVVYYDFSTGTASTLPGNTWHIAFDGNLNIIANSGNYGTGVSVCSTGITDFSQDFTPWFSDTTKKFTRTDTNANVLGTNWMNTSSMPPSYTGQVYLLKVKGTPAASYKVQFTGASMEGTVKMKIGPPDAASADEHTFTHNSEYEYTYINCADKEAVLVAPEKNAWDIRFGRTEFAMGTATGGRSSIAINKSGGVKVARVDSTDIDEVLDATGLSFSSNMLGIGHGWYVYDHTNRVFDVLPHTYVLKDTDGKYAKLKIATFNGPGTPSEKFYCIFEYLYQADGASAFSK